VHLEHLIAKKDLLPIPRAGRHSHFSVRLAFDDDADLVAGRDREKRTSPYPKSLTLLGEVTGVSAYGSRVSAYGFSHRRTYRLRQRAQ
jgi:hypothetical protein